MGIMIQNQIKLVVFTLLISNMRCSRVIDYQQQAMYVSEYCPRIGVCDEGTHVMCTHYNPNRTMGPLCVDVQNVSITPEYAQMFLDLLNIIRSRSSRAKSVGLEDLPLPKAYGMLKLEWDPELSTLAQLWANQCIISFDSCRATKRFPDPGQVAGITRFDSNWYPLNAKELFNYTGFSMEKVKYGIHSAVRSWYRAKEFVHPEDILDEKFNWPKYFGVNAFLQIVHGNVSHLGCGLSVFKEYLYHPQETDELHFSHNVVRIVCNLSSRLRPEPSPSRVYTTSPPTDVEFTVKCGCPLGYDEDEDCMCYRSGRKLPYKCKDKECKPAVVVLPIFTMEKAPPHKLIGDYRNNETNHKMIKTNEIDKSHSKRHELRRSIFLKPSVFELPARKLKGEIKESVKDNIKRDVTPRRDFSHVQNLVSRYLSERRNNNISNTKTQSNEDTNKVLRLQLRNKFIIDETNHKGKEEIGRFVRRRKLYDNLTSTRNPKDMYNDNRPKIDKNNKLMTLLNQLEEEVKYIQVATDKKDVYDKKLKTLYSTFIEKAYITGKRQTNQVTNRTFSSEDFLENDKFHKYEEQFNRVTEKVLIELVPNKNNKYKGINKIPMQQNLLDNNGRYNVSNNNHDHSKLLKMRNAHEIIKKQNSKKIEKNDFKKKIFQLKNDDILSLDKRKLYQEKLNDLERTLREFHNYRTRKSIHADNHFRRMLPTYRGLR